MGIWALPQSHSGPKAIFHLKSDWSLYLVLTNEIGTEVMCVMSGQKLLESHVIHFAFFLSAFLSVETCAKMEPK